MTTHTLTDAASGDLDPVANGLALAHLTKLRSEVLEYERAFLDTRAKLLLAYRQARRDRLTDNDLNGGSGAGRSIDERGT